MNRFTIRTFRSLLPFAVALLPLFSSCHREGSPGSGTQRNAPLAPPTGELGLRVSFTGDQAVDPQSGMPIASRRHDGLSLEDGSFPVFAVFVRNGDAEHKGPFEFEGMVPFKPVVGADGTWDWNTFESQVKIPVSPGEKTVYVLYYPSKLDKPSHYRTPKKEGPSWGEPLVPWEFTTKAYTAGYTKNIKFTDIIAGDEWYNNEQRAEFPIILDDNGDGTYWYPGSQSKRAYNTREQAVKAWGWQYTGIDQGVYWNSILGRGNDEALGTTDNTQNPQPKEKYTVRFGAGVSADQKVLPADWEKVPFISRLNRPHRALASGKAVIPNFPNTPGHTEMVTVPLYRDYARVRVFIAKDADKMQNGRPMKIGLRGIAFVNMRITASPAFLSESEYNSNTVQKSWGAPGANNPFSERLLPMSYKSVAIQDPRGMNYAIPLAVGQNVGGLAYPELSSIPSGEDVVTYMRKHPEKYQFFAPQYLAPFPAHRYTQAEIETKFAAEEVAGTFSDFAGYTGKADYFWETPRILLATYYADYDTSNYTQYKDITDAVWHYWVPFGEPLPGVPTTSRSRFCGDVLANHCYDVFVIVPTAMNKEIKVIVKSWAVRSIVIPDFE